MAAVGIEPGSIVRVRSRQYLVEEVIPPPRPGEDTCVRLSCLDDDAQGQEAQVLWESEVDAQVVTASAWDAAAKKGFDDPRRFAAWLHTQRWNCVTATDPRLLQSPWRAGIEVMAYQLEPLRKALLLPRVNLFIADDVGLGKTIEAGLIVRELLLRQRVRRVVVACPASVVWQWKNELESRFGLSFAVVDRDFLRRCRRERGYGINPWKTHNAFVISHNLLRDEDYAAPLRDWMEDKRPYTGSLLILDEAHNAAPASGSKYAIDSKLTQVVRDLKDHFEHRLFLSATPHNGHSNSFSALLEMLDPQRFCRGVPVKSAKLLDDVMVRRLKSDLSAAKAGRFPKRNVIQLDVGGLPTDSAELVLPELLERYRSNREQSLTSSKATRTQMAAGLLVTTSLQKRLLSSVDAFARTLGVHRKALERKVAAAALPSSPNLDLLRESPGSDDEELGELTPEQLGETEDAQTVMATSLAGGVSTSELKLLEEMSKIADGARHKADAKVLSLVDWMKKNCCPGGKWNERRVLIFTEYVDTLRVLRRHLEELLPDSEGRIDVFEGGAVLSKRREALKEAFNAHPWENDLRILIATDAAREGVNLQNYCADLFHFDVPWNPGRMEQRNGRIDRKHQREDEVRCHYFVYTQRPEDRVLQVLVEKSKTIQQELGSLSQVVDSKLAKRLAGGIRRAAIDELSLAIKSETTGDERKVIEEELEETRRTVKLEEQLKSLNGMLEVSRTHLGYSSEALRLALDESLSVIDAPSLGALGAGPNGKEMWSFPDLLDVKHAGPGWLEGLDTLRKPRKPEEKLWDWRRANKPRPVVFEDVGALDDDTVHLHLEQKLVQRLLGRFLSQGFVHDDLSRVCALLSPQSVAKVVLVGRLSLHGVGAARLHDELIHVTAPWLESGKRSGGLKPYRATAEALTLQELDGLLCREHVRAPDKDVLARLRGTLVDDVASLEPELNARAEAADKTARAALADRATREAKSLRQLLEAQQKRIRETLDKAGQQTLQFSDDEKRQAAAEHAHQRKRLAEIDRELVDEPKRLEGTYAVHARRLEVLGVVYLWPVKG
jgi:SNF2 family DNA or RNA helicase